MNEAADFWRAHGAKAVPKAHRDGLILRYFELLQQGFAAHLALAPPSAGKKPGRTAQDASKNFLDALLIRAEQVLAFLDDLAVPFTNNLAERDIRLVKVQQKISGCFRSFDGAVAFCHIRGYLSTLRKQGIPLLSALQQTLAGHPVSPAF